MAGRPRRWGNLSRATRDRYARQAEQFGVSRRSAREMYNRGTYKPAARSPERRAPLAVQRHPEKYAAITSQNMQELQNAAIDNVNRQLGDYFKFNVMRVVDNIIAHGSPKTLRLIANATEDQMTSWARYSDPEEAPQFIRAAGWYDEKGNWHNIFFYH